MDGRTPWRSSTLIYSPTFTFLCSKHCFITLARRDVKTIMKWRITTCHMGIPTYLGPVGTYVLAGAGVTCEDLPPPPAGLSWSSNQSRPDPTDPWPLVTCSHLTWGVTIDHTMLHTRAVKRFITYFLNAPGLRGSSRKLLIYSRLRLLRQCLGPKP